MPVTEGMEVDRIQVLHASQVVNDAVGIAFMTRDTFKDRAQVRSNKPLGVILPGLEKLGIA